MLIIVLIVTWVSVSSVEPGSDQSSEWWQVAVLWVSCLACWSRDQIRERREESPVLTRALTWVIWISWHNNMKPDLTRVTWCHWPTAHPRGLTWSLMWKRNLDQILPKQQESLRSNSNYFEVILAASAKSDPNFFSTSGSMSAPGGGQLVSGIRWHGWGLVSCCCVMIFISLMLELWWALGSPLSSLWSGPGSSRRDMTLTALLLVTTHCSDLNQARPMTPRLKLQSEQLSTKYIDP